MNTGRRFFGYNGGKFRIGSPDTLRIKYINGIGRFPAIYRKHISTILITAVNDGIMLCETLYQGLLMISRNWIPICKETLTLCIVVSHNFIDH
jgi:hypothetical protein